MAQRRPWQEAVRTLGDSERLQRHSKHMKLVGAAPSRKDCGSLSPVALWRGTPRWRVGSSIAVKMRGATTSRQSSEGGSDDLSAFCSCGESDRGRLSRVGSRPRTGSDWQDEQYTFEDRAAYSGRSAGPAGCLDHPNLHAFATT